MASWAILLWVGELCLCLGALASISFLIQDQNLRTRHFGVLYHRLPSVSALSRWLRVLLWAGHGCYGALWVRQWYSGDAHLGLWLFGALSLWVLLWQCLRGWQGRQGAFVGLAQSISLAGLVLLMLV